MGGLSDEVWIILIPASLSFLTAVVGLIAGSQKLKTHGAKIEEVHGLVNSRLTAVLESNKELTGRVEQLNAALAHGQALAVIASMKVEPKL